MTSLCSVEPIIVSEAGEPEPNGGIVEWITKHPIETVLIITATGALSYIVYDRLKKDTYTPSKKSIKSSGKK